MEIVAFSPANIYIQVINSAAHETHVDNFGLYTFLLRENAFTRRWQIKISIDDIFNGMLERNGCPMISKQVVQIFDSRRFIGRNIN